MQILRQCFTPTENLHYTRLIRDGDDAVAANASIRLKLFLLLLAIAIAPMAVVTWHGHVTTQRLGKELAEYGRAARTDNSQADIPSHDVHLRVIVAGVVLVTLCRQASGLRLTFPDRRL